MAALAFALSAETLALIALLFLWVRSLGKWAEILTVEKAPRYTKQTRVASQNQDIEFLGHEVDNDGDIPEGLI